MKIKPKTWTRLKAFDAIIYDVCAASPANLLKLMLCVGLLMGVTGCVGYVDGGYDGGAVIATGPDVYLFGGGGYYDHRRDVHAYSERGHVSRAAAHPVGGGHGGRH